MKMKPAISAILGVSSLAAYSFPAISQDTAQQTVGIEEIVVTAQKREESIQTVPIAVTALTTDALREQHINLAQDLARTVPNLNYSRAGLGFNETNFQLRGVGYQLVSTSGDAGVGVHVNNAPLGVNRLGQAEIYDMERVEVLRGPQGTLYGRNATGGVINLITAKPTLEFSGEGNIEYGSYDQKRLGGYVNLPMGDFAALRIAGFGLQRDGFTENSGAAGDIDGRDMWSGRATLALNMQGPVRATVMWQRGNEDDTRIGNTKTLCVKSAEVTQVGGVAVNNVLARQFLNRGCDQGSVYSPQAFGTVNYAGTTGGQLGNLSQVFAGDVFANVTQSDDLRQVHVDRTPSYVAKNDLVELNIEIDASENLKVTALTSYLKDSIYARASGLSYESDVAFSTQYDATGLTQGGVYNDPQGGASNRLSDLNISDLNARQWSQELRLQSSFDGPVNFNIGGLYMMLERTNDVYFAPNIGSLYAELQNLGRPAAQQIYIDPNVDPDGTGHNYYVSHNPYDLTASAMFGEVYWDATERLTLTAGVRYTDDKKEITQHPITLLTPGRGWPETGALAPIDQEARFKETTGRFNAAFRVTENNLVYASYSKGYKGGGINPPDVSGGELSPAYDPEFVNAYEIGSKNELVDGRVQANVTVFRYEYENYQISSMRGFTVWTDNVDADIHGLEFEGVWQPGNNLRLNTSIGWMSTELQGGTSIDTFDRTGGDPTLTLVKSTTSACVVSTAAMANFVNLMNNGTPVVPTASGPRALQATDILGICSGSFTALGLTPSAGVAVDLEGKELPQSPDLTAAVGAEYTWHLGNWNTKLRADYYIQTESFTRIYNTGSDRLKGWDNANASITFSNPEAGWDIQVYGKNLMDDDVITGFDTNSDALGLTRNVSVLDPRLVGISITKSF